MYTHVLITNGPVTNKLIWIQHTGMDVYYGFDGQPGRWSYHASGQHHHKSDAGAYSDVEHRVPLADIIGILPLSGTSFRNTEHMFASSHRTPFVPRPRKPTADAMLTIDARAIPPDRQIMLWFGLLEPGNGAALTELLSTRRDNGTVDSHLLLAMKTTPWVWALVDWLSDERHEELMLLAASRA